MFSPLHYFGLSRTLTEVLHIRTQWIKEMYCHIILDVWGDFKCIDSQTDLMQ